MTDTTITIGGQEASEPGSKRLSLMLWAQSGAGKTTLACTLPGRKALISFDPDGSASVAGWPDVTVFDLSRSNDNIAARMLSDDPLGIKSAMEHFDSFIIDSLTTVEERTLAYGISQTKGATLIRPSPGAYGARGAVVVNLVRHILSITAAAEKHVCFTAHEAPLTTDDDGHALGINPALGGKTPQQVALRMNEVWSLWDRASDGKKILTVKPSRLRAPIKTRMFDTMREPEFIWKFDANNPDDPDNMRLDTWFEAWKENGFRKMPLPK